MKIGVIEKQRPAIALYFYKLNRSAGGAERMICALANGLCANGFAVHLVSWDEPDAVSFYALSADVRWHRLGFRQGPSDKIRRTRLLAATLREQRICVLAGFVMSGDRTVYAAAKWAGVRIIAAERNAPAMYYLRYGLAQRLAGFLMLGLTDGITVQFPEFIEGYPKWLRARMTVIPNPVPSVSTYAQPEYPDQNGVYTMLAVGRLDDVQKRFDCLIRAFARVAQKHPSWRLLIVGEGPQGAALQKLIDELGLGNRVDVRASTPDIFDTYVHAHLFAIPSRWEGFSNALAEAMTHGLPAVGFRDAAGVAHLISDGIDGWLADGLDDDVSLGQALDMAMTDGAERARRGTRAITAMAAYSPEAQIKKWVQLFNAHCQHVR